MNLAFPALCIVLLVLPGILFRKAYTRGALYLFRGDRQMQTSAVNKYPVSTLPLTEEIGVSLITAVVLHIFWLSVCTWLTQWTRQWTYIDFKPNYEKLLYVLYGGLTDTSKLYSKTLDYVAGHHTSLTLYFLSLYVISGLLGRVWLEIVRFTGWDRTTIFLRLEDQWFYFLYGEIFQFSEFRHFLPDTPPITGTYVSVVVAHGTEDVLYKGFLWDFYLDKSGNLDRLLLHNVIRCWFDPTGGRSRDTKEEDGDRIKIISRAWAFERISSQIFTVKYADCKTLACTYFSITETTPAALSPGRALL